MFRGPHLHVHVHRYYCVWAKGSDDMQYHGSSTTNMWLAAYVRVSCSTFTDVHDASPAASKGIHLLHVCVKITASVSKGPFSAKT
jgi:hypothetical protein